MGKMIKIFLLFAIFIVAGSCDSKNDSANNDNFSPTINKPPKPIIIVNFENPLSIDTPMSYKAFTQVHIDLGDSCVSDPENPEKYLKNWDEKYVIEYKWKMIESPTPFNEQSKLNETDWNNNAKSIFFTGVMSTPRRSPEKNKNFNSGKCASECGDEPIYDSKNPDRYFFLKYSNYLICKQNYCEKTQSKHYKINIQARTVDDKTGIAGDPVEITLVPKIVPQARVVVQLTYKQGFGSRAESFHEGTGVDLDLHLIKKVSLEANNYGFEPEGRLGTVERSGDMAYCSVTLPECEKYWRHDDCSFSDRGITKYNIDSNDTIRWHASFDYDNTYGGGNYENPETIGLGPITDTNGDGIPDSDIIDDQYLVAVGYVGCSSNYSDGFDRCDSSYKGEDGAYEIDARVEIFVDGEEVPRTAGKNRVGDNYEETSKNFKIKLNEWKVVAVIKWDNSLESPKSNPLYPGSAIVTDVAMPDEGIEIDPVNHPICSFDSADAILVPIWDAATYRQYVETITNDGRKIGICHEPQV